MKPLFLPHNPAITKEGLEISAAFDEDLDRLEKLGFMLDKKELFD